MNIQKNIIIMDYIDGLNIENLDDMKKINI